MIQLLWDQLLDSDCEGEPLVQPQRIAPVEEATWPLEQRPRVIPTCWSIQHPSIAQGTASSQASSSCGDMRCVCVRCVQLVSAPEEVSRSGPDFDIDISSGEDEPAVASAPEEAPVTTAGPAVVMDVSSGEDEPTAAVASAMSSDPTVRFWIGMIGNRMVEADAFVQASGGRIVWHLSPLRRTIVDWTIRHIHNILSQQYVQAFYIGLTARLEARWLGAPPFQGRPRMVGHKAKGWHKMFLVAVSDNPCEIGDAKKAVITKFRKWDRFRLVNHEGHFLCSNRNPGGEGAYGGCPPHILYVLVRWNPRS